MKKIICLVLGLLVLASGCSFNLLDSPQELPVVGSIENLKQLVEASRGNEKYYMLETDMRAPAAEATTDASAPGHSSTNVQVQGVDEADVVKTDGTYIYHIAGNKVLITMAWPADSLGIVKELEFDKGFFPNTLYVDDNHLVVIGSQRDSDNLDTPDVRHILPWFTTVARVLVYDISDMSNVTLSNDITLDGYTVTTRKKDDVLYIINSRYVGLLIDGPEPTLPWYKDSTDGDKTEIGYEDICYFPEGDLGEYILFAALDLNSGELNVDTYLGWAQNVYMSTENLYVAMSNWMDMTTTVYRFAVNGTSLDYMAEGKVKGTVLNQFSMDEYDGYFRIATNYNSPMVIAETPDSPAPAEENVTTNYLYVLDSSMQVVGQIDNIAPGESIMSARFMGEKGYLVTFEQIDPLFVIDLSNPRNPKILGELKIPGFSTYLHPLDDQHLLGIGWDTELGSFDGREFVTTNGMKLAIFDVSDVNNPKEEHVVKIGKMGTWSEALYEHKAVFYHEGILAFNAAIMETDYKLTYQGALFYDVDLESGFREIGRITHIANPTGEWFEAYSGIKRVVQIGDVYYTVSDKYVMAHSKDSFAKLGGIDLPALPEPEYYR